MPFARSKIPLLKRRRDLYATLASWYGADRAKNEIAAHTATPRPLGEILETVSGEILSADAADFTRLEAAWESIAGRTAAKLAHPVGCRDKCVILGVRHSAMLAELRPSLDLLKDKINRDLGRDFCREIKLTIV